MPHTQLSTDTVSFDELTVHCFTTGAPLSLKELANRFIASQRANWRNPSETARSYRDWLGRFLRDHRGILVAEFTVE